MNEPNESDLFNQDVGPPSKRRLSILDLMLAMVADLRKATPRDAAHWIGVVCWFGFYICPTALMMIALQFVAPAELFGNV